MSEDVYLRDTYTNASEMREAAGWEPRISFEEGIERACHQYTRVSPESTSSKPVGKR